MKPVITYVKNISLGWWLLAVALLGAWKGLRYKFVEDSSCRTNKDKEILAISDAPIKTFAEDEFSRGAYVRMLSALIMSSPNEREARYIGIYAPWGDGKTSVRFLLEERIRLDYGDDSAIIVDFSPWQYPESADIRMLFFERLANAVANAGCDDVSKMSSLVAKYFAMTRINRSVGPLHDVIDWLRKLFVFGVFSEESLTADFRELLSAMEKKVVVVVDDLDRLSKEETCRVIRFLKANGDLPNITYLILADEAYLANAVASLVAHPDKTEIECGREYLKKIIPLRCPLPPINGNRLLTNFKQRLASLLCDYDLEAENPKETCDWLLLPYMDNTRVAKQLLNAFSIKLATYKRQVGGRKYLNVHIGDLLALTVIEVCEPDFHAKLWDGYMGLLHDSWRYFGSGKGLSEQWMEDHFFCHAKGKRDLVGRFLSERLGVAHSGGGYNKDPVTYKLDKANDPELMLHYRLASAASFQHYFLIEEEIGRLSQDDVNDFLSEVNAGRIPEGIIRRLDESGMLSQLLYALESEKMLSTKAASDCYIKTLIYMANLPLRNLTMPPEYQNGFFEQSIYVGIYRCLLFYCKDVNTHVMNEKEIYGVKIERIGELLLPLLKDSSDVVLTSYLIGHDKEYHESETSLSWYDAFFSHEEYETLRRLYLDRIERFQREGRLVGHVEFRDLFYRWRVLLQEYNEPVLNDKFKVACLSMTRDVQAINQMILFFCDDNRSSNIHSRLIVAIQLDSLTDAFGKKGVKSIVSTLESAQYLPEYTYKALVSLRWVLKQKAANKPYGKDEQMGALKGLYESEKIKAEMAAKVIKKETVK
ncbi:MAG: hypothetical protein J6P13_04990 [Kiritimatiellae bacterium]|nr:hypothetical protein [Kiritimatiellia bacterium]